MSEDLGQILNGSAETPSTEAPAPVEAKADAAPVEQQGETPAETPAASDQPKIPGDERHVPVKALKAEREKRQEAAKRAADLERQVAELQGRISVYSQNGQQQTQQPVDPDSEFYANPTKWVQQQLEQGIGKTRVEVARARADMSVAMVKSQFPDYAEKESAFLEAAKANPHLIQQLQQHDHPAMFAYETGKLYSEVSSVGSIDELRESIRAQVRAEIEAEQRSSQASESAGKITPSAASARGNGATHAVPFAPPSLASIIGR